MIILGLILSAAFVAGIDENRFKENTCIAPPSSQELGLDLKWFGSIEKWTVPLWTNLYSVRTASDAFEREPASLGPVGDSCLVFKNDMTVTAYGRKINYVLTGDATSIGFRSGWPGAKGAKFEFHLTDNESFVLGITCWDDNQSGYALISTTPYLSAAVKERVLRYVYGKGFNRRNTKFENYAKCGDSSNRGVSRGGVDEPYKEKTCIAPPTSQQLGLDLNWFGSIERWMVPVWTNLYALRTAHDAYEREPSSLGSLSSSCLIFKNDMTVNAYGRKINYTLSGDATSIGFKAGFPGAKGAKFEFHLTDNESFVLGVTCWEDNQAGFAIISTKPQLDAGVRERVLRYVYGKGFRQQNTRFEDYNECGGRESSSRGYPTGGYSGSSGGYSSGSYGGNQGADRFLSDFGLTRSRLAAIGLSRYQFEAPVRAIQIGSFETSDRGRGGRYGQGGY